MRFACNREQLAEAISTVERAVPSRDVDDHLKGILLEAHEDRLQLTAFDLHLGIECSTPADVARQGAVMVDARLFSQLTRKLPAEQEIGRASCRERVKTLVGAGLYTSSEDIKYRI